MAGHNRPLHVPGSPYGCCRTGDGTPTRNCLDLRRYPQEWLRELERDGHKLERQGEPPVMYRMVA